MKAVLHFIYKWLGLLNPDPSYALPDGSVFHPTLGTPGSVFITSDHQHYLRSPSGWRKIPLMVGQFILRQQRRVRRITAVKRGTLALTVIAALIVLVEVIF